MKRWILVAASSLSLAGAAALLPAGVAFAHTADGGAQHAHHPHKEGLLREALELGSLSADQRSSIEQLVERRRDASGPVRTADAQLLTALAGQVEQAAIDTQALAPALHAEQAAADAKGAVERDTLNALHGVLTPAQRGELVDRVEASRTQRGGSGGTKAEGEHVHPRPGAAEGLRNLGLSDSQKTQIFANLRAEGPAPAGRDGGARGEHAARRAAFHQALESFRGDSFDASALVPAGGAVKARGERGEWAEKFAQAAVPVLTAPQRATLAGDLRDRAARESAPRGSGGGARGGR